MSNISILIIVISSFIIISVFLLYLKYYKNFKPLLKISINDTFGILRKITLFGTITMSLFFSFFIASSASSSEVYENIDSKLYSISKDNNWAQYELIAGEYYFGDIDYDGTNCDPTNDPNWIGTNTTCLDTLDRRNWDYPSNVQDIIENYGNSFDDLLVPIEQSNPLFSIPYNDYLYYFQYALANI